MIPDTPIKKLDELRNEEDALDQSLALNKIVMTMLESKRREDFWLRWILIISLLVNVVISGIFIAYESQFTVTPGTTETTAITQDTGEGNGNNVYQSGENASYNQDRKEEVKSDGTANSDSSENYSGNENKDIGGDSDQLLPGG